MEINRVIDLTTNNFGRIDFEEAEILEFDYFDKPFDNVEFEIWGAKLLVDDFWDHDKSFLPGVPHSDDYYVAGKGMIRIQQVLGIDMIFSPYFKTEDSYKFLYDSTGNVIEKRWRRGEIEKGDNYLWECVLIHPHGYFKLNIYACGCIEYEFDDKDMVLEKDFLKSPFKYAYRNADNKELCRLDDSFFKKIQENRGTWKIQKGEVYDIWSNKDCSLIIEYLSSRCRVMVDYKGYNVILPMGIWGFEDEIRERNIQFEIDGEKGDFKSLRYIINIDDLSLFGELVCMFLKEHDLDTVLNDAVKLYSI